MKKKFKCPVCGEETISIKEKRKLDYRYKSKLRCSNCNSRLRESKTSILLILGCVLLGGYIAIQEISWGIKTILLILLSVLYLYMNTYVIPIVKDDD